MYWLEYQLAVKVVSIFFFLFSFRILVLFFCNFTIIWSKISPTFKQSFLPGYSVYVLYMFIEYTFFLHFKGTADYLQNPCPVGHYCNNGVTKAQPCPAGSFREKVGGKVVADCTKCPKGRYCPINGSAASFSCSNGTYCPEGTVLPEWCEAGFYCPNAEKKIPCSSGYYCPNASASPTPCDAGHYCRGNDNCTLTEGGAVVQTICPFGKSNFFFINVTKIHYKHIKFDKIVKTEMI